MAERVCPVWVGHLLASPLRKLFQNPSKIIAPYIKKGMKVLDVGCAMGFFSVPMARLVGDGGKVVCVDMQEKMLKSLKKRARKAGVSGAIETITCDQDSLRLGGFKEEIDFALAFAVVHEVPDVPKLFSDIFDAMKPAGKLLIAEPRGHVSDQDFDKTTAAAESSGFAIIQRPKIGRSRTVLLEKTYEDPK
jgi:ubiquinone/menaquinone biosynthesis C-methylase UbiE